MTTTLTNLHKIGGHTKMYKEEVLKHIYVDKNTQKFLWMWRVVDVASRLNFLYNHSRSAISVRKNCSTFLSL